MTSTHRAPIASRPPAGRAPLAAAALLAAALAPACSSSDDGDDPNDTFLVRSTQLALANGASALAIDGDWLAFPVSEAGQGASGTDYNGDGDLLDSIAARTDTSAQSTVTLDVAVTSLAFARRTLFLVVEESQDSVDWNGDTDMMDRVLLYVESSATTPTFLDTLDASSPIAAIGGTVVYAGADAPGGNLETNLRFVTVATNGAAPGAPQVVTTGADPGNDGITYGILGSDDDIVFLTADETVEGGTLNNDADATDTTIFAVLDAGAASPEAFLVEVAIGPATTPTAVPVAGGGEFLVAFLADESQESVSLNDPADFSMTWASPGCTGADVDTSDFVLHWFQLTDLAMSTAAVNTGLVGASDGRALALRSRFVGVVSPEGDQGGPTCDYNGDGDSTDPIFRWVAASNPAAPPLPPTTTTLMIAVDETVSGEAQGVVRLTDTWVISVDEAADGRSAYDGDPGTDRSIMLALNPGAATPAWNAAHSGSAMVPVGLTWMEEDPDNPAEFFGALDEEVRTLFSAGDLNGDGDTNDSMPVVPRPFSGGSTNISFPGVAVASVSDNAGVTVEENFGFFRISEFDEDATDLNGDGDTNDAMLGRFSTLGASGVALMATLNDLSRTSVEFGPGDAVAGALITDESQASTDLNGDGDTADFVVRYFRLP